MTGTPDVVWETENEPQAEPEQPEPLADQLTPFGSVVVAVTDKVWLTGIAPRLGDTETPTLVEDAIGDGSKGRGAECNHPTVIRVVVFVI